mmetsp:Transcript_17034/g.51726  ORF Transcript_17034/g.51726 Transcript_17034/m.51726 type:complete len:206 (-) Transcript_17034:1100-1717(-)
MRMTTTMAMATAAPSSSSELFFDDGEPEVVRGVETGTPLMAVTLTATKTSLEAARWSAATMSAGASWSMVVVRRCSSAGGASIVYSAMVESTRSRRRRAAPSVTATLCGETLARSAMAATKTASSVCATVALTPSTTKDDAYWIGDVPAGVPAGVPPTVADGVPPTVGDGVWPTVPAGVPAGVPPTVGDSDGAPAVPPTGAGEMP